MVYFGCIKGYTPQIYYICITNVYPPKKTLIGVAVRPEWLRGFLGGGVVLFVLILFVGTGRSFCRLLPTIISRQSKFIKRVEPRSVWILFFNITKIGVMKFIYILLIPLIMGCATTNQRQALLESWLNSHKSELFAKNGAPNRVISDGLGGEILVYEKYIVTSIGGSGYSTIQYTEFFADKDGIIYRARSGMR